MKRGAGKLSFRPKKTEELLSHPYARYRAKGIEILESQRQGKDRDTFAEQLKPLLKDKNNRVRANAARALYGHQSDVSLMTLEDMVYSDDKWARASGAWALGTIKDPRVVKPLTHLLKDGEESVLKRAVLALNDIKELHVNPELDKEISLLLEEYKDKLEEYRNDLNTGIKYYERNDPAVIKRQRKKEKKIQEFGQLYLSILKKIRKKIALKQEKPEKRRHKRLPTISMAKKILITSPELNFQDSVPAIMYDLSAGGIALISSIYIPPGTILSFRFALTGENVDTIEGRVVRVESKKDAFLVGVSFTKIDDSLKSKINRMAEDYDRCESRIVKDEKDICFKDCAYYEFCSKAMKLD